MKLIEKVAFAALKALEDAKLNGLKLDDVPEIRNKIYNLIGKAAIETMREPTEEMINSKIDFKFIEGETFEHVRNRAKATYQAMIDAALKEI